MNKKKLYKYGMRLRGCSIGTQPRGLVKWEKADKLKDGYWDYIYYEVKLDKLLEEDYDLDYLGKVNSDEDI